MKETTWIDVFKEFDEFKRNPDNIEALPLEYWLERYYIPPIKK